MCWKCFKFLVFTENYDLGIDGILEDTWLKLFQLWRNMSHRQKFTCLNPYFISCMCQENMAPQCNLSCYFHISNQNTFRTTPLKINVTSLSQDALPLYIKCVKSQNQMSLSCTLDFEKGTNPNHNVGNCKIWCYMHCTSNAQLKLSANCMFFQYKTGQNEIWLICPKLECS